MPVSAPLALALLAGDAAEALALGEFSELPLPEEQAVATAIREMKESVAIIRFFCLFHGGFVPFF
ncbi:hypothetical protein [Cohnella rhizosphaerae]|uniref:Uncharacterized protein n=1 Tax=Cohnella rhizosphaerae TaxID=1457232 RepID=A0A9X4KYI3_9BACL|nr:hypothetical protein [Cohnella rhizosphaerae]MDG0813585.1 hypothetical protein [Cohnella rhizosphaerae]